MCTFGRTVEAYFSIWMMALIIFSRVGGCTFHVRALASDVLHPFAFASVYTNVKMSLIIFILNVKLISYDTLRLSVEGHKRNTSTPLAYSPSYWVGESYCCILRLCALYFSLFVFCLTTLAVTDMMINIWWLRKKLSWPVYKILSRNLTRMTE